MWVSTKTRKGCRTQNVPFAASWCVTEVRVAGERNYGGPGENTGKTMLA